jgi:hypothetical protein
VGLLFDRVELRFAPTREIVHAELCAIAVQSQLPSKGRLVPIFTFGLPSVLCFELEAKTLQTLSRSTGNWYNSTAGPDSSSVLPSLEMPACMHVFSKTSAKKLFKRVL